MSKRFGFAERSRFAETADLTASMEDDMEPPVFGTETFRDRTKMNEFVTRNAMLLYHHRVEPAVLENWAGEAVAELWTDDVRVTRFIPTLALREVASRVAEAERGGPSSKGLSAA